MKLPGKTHRTWHLHAACAGMDTTIFLGPEPRPKFKDGKPVVDDQGNQVWENPRTVAALFYKNELAVRRAKRICDHCVVQPACKREAMAFTKECAATGDLKSDYFGIYGGLTGPERAIELSRYSQTEQDRTA